MLEPIRFERVDELPVDAAGQCQVINDLLDRRLSEAIGEGPDPVVLFSGGVDSGLLAARLAAMGRRETLLFNYAFHPEDPESALAEAMARKLELSFHRHVGDPGLGGTLDSPGLIYPQPFGDLSVVPTADLAQAVLDHLGGDQRLIVDGTGADGAFGLAAKVKRWKRLARVPTPIDRLAARSYEVGFWRNHGRLAKMMRALRLLGRMPFLPAMLARDGHGGILYDDQAVDEAAGLLVDWIASWAQGPDLVQAIAADLALICTNVFAQKAHQIFTGAGMEVCYPFLEKDSISFALAAAEAWPMGEPKAVLKRSLARSVPAGMVYRPKSGFVDPHRSLFDDPVFLDHLWAAADDSSPLSPVLNSPEVRRVVNRLGRGEVLPNAALSCLWNITFVDRWYRSAPR